jgi:hypothetical protein
VRPPGILWLSPSSHKRAKVGRIVTNIAIIRLLESFLTLCITFADSGPDANSNRWQPKVVRDKRASIHLHKAISTRIGSSSDFEDINTKKASLYGRLQQYIDTNAPYARTKLQRDA